MWCLRPWCGDTSHRFAMTSYNLVDNLTDFCQMLCKVFRIFVAVQCPLRYCILNLFSFCSFWSSTGVGRDTMDFTKGSNRVHVPIASQMTLGPSSFNPKITTGEKLSRFFLSISHLCATVRTTRWMVELPRLVSSRKVLCVQGSDESSPVHFKENLCFLFICFFFPVQIVKTDLLS